MLCEIPTFELIKQIKVLSELYRNGDGSIILTQREKGRSRH